VNHTIGFLIESTVVVLLVIMIGYCFVLERRLRRLRSDEHSLRAVIAALITATAMAERAIAGLKVTVRESDQTLGERLRAAERFTHDIERQLAAGGIVLRRFAEIAAAGQPPQSAPASNTRSTLAAAQAFAQRARNRGDVAA